jgi:hypothetical protein
MFFVERCEVEISGLRKKNHDLESAMRELQVKMLNYFPSFYCKKFLSVSDDTSF